MLGCTDDPRNLPLLSPASSPRPPGFIGDIASETKLPETCDEEWQRRRRDRNNRENLETSVADWGGR